MADSGYISSSSLITSGHAKDGPENSRVTNPAAAEATSKYPERNDARLE
jgi:hypothetical protein